MPCDFSETSVEALKFAATLARRMKAEVQLVHAIELPALYDSAAVLEFERDYMTDQKAKSLKKLSGLQQRWGKGIGTEVLVEFGGTLSVIEDVIKSGGVDLVVMGTHGASGLKEYTIGSNTEKIVRRSKVPVIALRRAAQQVKNIVFPVYPGGDQERMVARVKDLQSIFKAKLHVLFVNTPAVFHRDADISPKLALFAERYRLTNYTLNVYNDTDEVEGIINFTNKLESPLVAMKTRGRIGLTHIANGSIAEDVVNHIKCPVWTFKTN